MKVKENVILDEKTQIVSIKDLKKVTSKKISGTNFAIILGANTFQTPFQVWCDMMKIYKKPFVETKEQSAGKTIEPIQAKYIREKYNLKGLTSPTDKFGENYFYRTKGNFFPMDDHFQGMWDYLNINLESGETTAVIEMKTTKKSKKAKWEKEGIPFYYKLQAALYTYLSKIDKFVFVVSFLEEEDYEHPERFVPNEENTMIKSFSVAKDMYGFEEHFIKPAIIWWNNHIVTGISPKYDEFNTDDVEIVKTIKKELEENKNQTVLQIKDIVKDDDCPFF